MKWIDFEGDIYFSDQTRIIPFDLAFSMGWSEEEIVLATLVRFLIGISTRSRVFRVTVTKFSIGGTVFTVRKSQRVPGI